MSLLTAIAALVGIAAVAEDLARGQISNWTSGGAFVGGLACHLWERGFPGAAGSLLGALTGFGLLLGFYLKGGMGGADLKLMAGFGALLGASAILKAALLASVVGGLMALGYVVVDRVRQCWRGRFSKGPDSGAAQERGPETIPYAPAIAVGAWLVLIAQM